MGKCASKQAISDFPEQSLRVKLCSVGIGSAHLYHWLALQRHITANTTEEIKFDGFRALAYIDDGCCRLDLEGIVAKWKDGCYIADNKRSNWVKDQEQPRRKDERNSSNGVSLP